MGADVSIELSIEDERWARIDLPTIAHRACQSAIDEVGSITSASISILATSNAHIAELNREFRGKPVPTNVLSWPTENLAPEIPGGTPDRLTDPEIGDIALAYEVCESEAAAFGVDIHDHVTHLVLHGCLHLLGYDHIHDEDATVMERLEIMALEKLGIKNPYL